MAEKFTKAVDELVKDLVKDYEDKVFEFIDRVVDYYHLNELELQTLWKTPMVDAVESDEVKYCNHKFTKGKRIGMLCLQKISGGATVKCSKHHKKSKDKPVAAAVVEGAVCEIPSLFSKAVTLLESDTEEGDSE